MSNKKNSSICEDESCKKCESKECPESSAYVEHEPSIIKFMLNHLLNMFKYICQGFINIVKGIAIFITAPWGIPYAGLVFNEIQKMYFERIKEKNIPYLNPPSFMMKDAIAAISLDKKIRKEIASKIRKDNGGSIWFYIKIFFIPFHFSGQCVKDKTSFIKETMKYNNILYCEIEKKTKDDGSKMTQEKMAHLTLESMEIFAKTFIIRKEGNEQG